MPRSRLRDRARQLRVDQTAAEEILWKALRNRKLGGWKWKRQVPRGDYILDFYCADAALVVELDGWSHTQPRQFAYDSKRTARLQGQELTVLRFANVAVIEDVTAVCAQILAECGGEPPHPNPLPASQGEGF